MKGGGKEGRGMKGGGKEGGMKECVTGLLSFVGGGVGLSLYTPVAVSGVCVHSSP
jgi:hypothetical protein